jgi:hypothetical protein
VVPVDDESVELTELLTESDELDVLLELEVVIVVVAEEEEVEGTVVDEEVLVAGEELEVDEVVVDEASLEELAMMLTRQTKSLYNC